VPLKQPAKTIAGPVSGAKFLLLGEDDIDDEELLIEAFAGVDNSLTLLFVNNGKNVIATLEGMENHHLPCLIILDYNMPTLNGAELLQELKRYPRYDSIPKIIWSTSNSNTYKDLCLQLGACDYVTKPSSMQALIEVARYMLSFCSAH
jgi:CheY-like chemotaxis protein